MLNTLAGFGMIWLMWIGAVNWHRCPRRRYHHHCSRRPWHWL